MDKKLSAMVELPFVLLMSFTLFPIALYSGFSSAKINAEDTMRSAAVQDINAGIADLYVADGSIYDGSTSVEKEDTLPGE